MVKKLFKHEFASYSRIILPMNLILLAVALLTRIVQIFDDNSSTYNSIFATTIIIFVVSCIVCAVLTTIFSIKRFYSNLFTHEGYLSFTLPVSATQHIFTKLTVAVCSLIFSFVMIIASVCVVTFGDVCVEVFKVIGYILGDMYKEFGVHLVFYIIEFAVLCIVSLTVGYLTFYGCISIGQRANKNRIPWAVVAYFVYYVIFQIVGTMFIIIISSLHDTEFMKNIAEFIAFHTNTFIHLFICGYIVFELVLGTIFFFITKHNISKKLNLE